MTDKMVVVGAIKVRANGKKEMQMDSTLWDEAHPKAAAGSVGVHTTLLPVPRDPPRARTSRRARGRAPTARAPTRERVTARPTRAASQEVARVRKEDAGTAEGRTTQASAPREQAEVFQLTQ